MAFHCMVLVLGFVLLPFPLSCSSFAERFLQQWGLGACKQTHCMSPFACMHKNTYAIRDLQAYIRLHVELCPHADRQQP